MARDRRRARPRPAPALSGADATRPDALSDHVPASLDHAGEVDEFEAGILHGAETSSVEDSGSVVETGEGNGVADAQGLDVAGVDADQDYGTAPASDDYTTAPASDDYATAPASDDYGAAPPSDDDEASPHDDGYDAATAGDGYDAATHGEDAPDPVAEAALEDYDDDDEDRASRDDLDIEAVDRAQTLATGSGGGGGRPPTALRPTGESERPARGPREAEPRQGLLRRTVAFLRASWAELQRVQWPDRRHVFQATAVVIGFVVVAGVYLGVADWVAGKLVNLVI